MPEIYQRQLELPVSTDAAFAWHERPGALARLLPPWRPISVVSLGDGIGEGSEVEMIMRLGPLRFRWVARHHGYQRGKCFRDTQVSGPFAHWEHTHRFTPGEDGGEDDTCVLTDRVEYRFPGGPPGRWLGRKLIDAQLESMFAYRHRVTRDDLAAHRKHREHGSMKIAITGAGGLVGSSLVPMLTTGGHEVTRMVRHDPKSDQVAWDPQAASFDAAALEGIDAVVHLAGESIAAKRWSTKVKQKIRDSRVQGTRVLCEGLAGMKSPPKVLACASAIGIYGDRGSEELTEESPAGSGFLADVAAGWEAATDPARAAGIRVVNLRFGVILSPQDGALAKMLLPFKLGGGGRVGSGRQVWSWISIDDTVGAIHHALLTDTLSGAVNVVAPNPVTNAEFTKTLGRVLHRPTVIPMPAPALRLMLGEMADELLLASAHVRPQKLLTSGYEYRHPTLETALRHVLGKTDA